MNLISQGMRRPLTTVAARYPGTTTGDGEEDDEVVLCDPDVDVTLGRLLVDGSPGVLHAAPDKTKSVRRTQHDAIDLTTPI
jgi:hypothetical protein